MINQSSHNGFTGLGIAPGLLNAIARLNFTEPTPIQRRTIPIGIEGKDVIAIAQTGTGKTLAFGVPSTVLGTNPSKKTRDKRIPVSP